MEGIKTRRNKSKGKARMYLYNKGDERIGASGGWDIVTYSNGSGTINSQIFTKEIDNLHSMVSTGSMSVALQKVFVTHNKIDITQYSKMYVKGVFNCISGNSDSRSFGLGCSTNNTSYSMVSVITLKDSNTNERTVELDIASLNGLYYIALLTTAGNASSLESKVYEVWFE